jgi:hypothetical protein
MRRIMEMDGLMKCDAVIHIAAWLRLDATSICLLVYMSR